MVSVVVAQVPTQAGPASLSPRDHAVARLHALTAIAKAARNTTNRRINISDSSIGVYSDRAAFGMATAG